MLGDFAGCGGGDVGGARDVTHDTIGRVITDDIRRVIGSNMQLEPRHIFTNTFPPRAGLNEHDSKPARRVRLGIIPRRIATHFADHDALQRAA